MGLDNSVCVKFHTDKMSWSEHLPSKIFYIAESINYYRNNEYDPTHPDETNPVINCELIYWRKWWGVRNEVINTLDTKYDYHHIEQYHYPLDSEDVESIIDILEDYDNDSVWNNYGDSVWYYDEDHIHDQITADIEVLKTLAKFMRTTQYKDMLRDNVIEVYFYDSY